MSQTFRNYEVIIIDDGSTDRSAAICDSYRNHTNVTVIHQENHGLPQTRQLGLEKAQGIYVIFMDADDWVDENHLLVRYECLKNGCIELLWSAYHDHRRELIIPPPTSVFSSSKERIKARYHNRITGYVWNKTYLRKFLKRNNIHFGSYNRGEDSFFNIQVYFYARYVAFDSHATYHYRYNPLSMSNKKTIHSQSSAGKRMQRI